MYSFRRDERTWWDDQRVNSAETSTLARFEPLSSERKDCATVCQVRHPGSSSKRKGNSADLLRYHPSERGRMKEIHGYQVAKLVKNYKLPLIFRKPVCEDPDSPGDKGSRLPPLSASSGQHQVMERGGWRDPLARCSKVVSIPPVERRLVVPNMMTRPALEAKGTKARAHSRCEETVDKKKSKPFVN